MPLITQAPSLLLATLWADVLKGEGIDASVQRQFLGSASGELPPDQCLPEVWIKHPEQETRARQVILDFQSVRQRRWTCACGELVEGGFEACWNCDAPMPA
jgi:hypothetical protein